MPEHILPKRHLSSLCNCQCCHGKVPAFLLCLIIMEICIIANRGLAAADEDLSSAVLTAFEFRIMFNSSEQLRGNTRLRKQRQRRVN